MNGSIAIGDRHGRSTGVGRSVAPLLTCLLASSLAAACGDKPPAAPDPTIQSIAVQSSGAALPIGTSETFTATATLSNNIQVQNVSGTWSTDSPTTLSVVTLPTGGGQVTAVSTGVSMVFVDSGGRRAARQVRSVPNYHGNWSGRYAMDTCTHSGGLAQNDFCGTLFGSGRELPLALQIVQTGDALSGRTSLAIALSDPFTASIAVNGSVVINARIISGTSTIDQVWNITTDGPAISGTLSVTVRDSLLTGTGQIEGRLLNTNRTLDVLRVRPLR